MFVTVSYTVLPSSITTFSENRRILGDVVLFTHCKIALLQFDWSRAPVSHLHMQNKQESEMGNEMIERKDGAGKNARRRRETGRAALKVVGWLRSRCTKWVAAGSERASDGRRKKKREREAKLMQLLSRTNAFGAAEYRSHISSDCSIHWTSFLQYALHKKSCIIWATIYGLLYLPLSSLWQIT